VEVNSAGREQLLRVPGIGPIIAERILRERRRGRLTDLAHLHTMGANVTRAAEYVLLDGRRPARQLSLWG
jgi:predicted DNA-binding helix-hairpin-helix protein